MSIVFKYDLGKDSSDKKVIFDSGIQLNMDLFGLLLGHGGLQNNLHQNDIPPIQWWNQ